MWYVERILSRSEFLFVSLRTIELCQQLDDASSLLSLEDSLHT
jgi:hypothetical protein